MESNSSTSLSRVREAQASDFEEPPGSLGRRAALALPVYLAVLATGVLARRRYIDPGSGSFAIQIIIAAVLGGLLTARLWLRHMFWRVLGLVRRKKTDGQPAGEEADR